MAETAFAALIGVGAIILCLLMLRGSSRGPKSIIAELQRQTKLLEDIRRDTRLARRAAEAQADIASDTDSP